MLVASLKPSVWHSVSVLLVAVPALTGLWMSTESWMIRAAFGFAIVVAVLEQVFSALHCQPSSVCEIQKIDHVWWIKLRNGSYRRVQLMAPRVVLSWFVLVIFTDGRHRYPCPVLVDALDKTQFRRLRMAVWWETQLAQHPFSQLTKMGWYQNGIGRMRRN